ncbi:MAG: enoyl-CoA hydratase/isomerase family protein [Streptosporangiaceae bacterium]
MDAVGYELKGPEDAENAVAVLTLNEPESRNALSRAIREGLWAALARFEADERARVAILTGAGDKAFCAGADLKELAAENLDVPPPGYVPIVGRDVHLSKVLIAAVNGAALGGGFLLAQMADLLVAVEHATFGMPEARVGRGAPWSVPLSRMVPRRIWLEMCLTGEPISARRAHETGFANDVVPSDELMPTAFRLAERIAANAPLTVRASRRMVDLAGEMGRTEAWDAADAVFEPVYRSADAQEGPRAFQERRTPRWTGR